MKLHLRLAPSLFGILVAMVAAGCGGQLQPADAETAAAATSATPTLSFNADWSVTQTAHVVSGGKAILHYDVARLARCRASYHGFPAWGITAYWAVDGGPAFSQSVVQRDANNQVVPVDVTLDVPPGHDLAFWFQSGDEYGCSDWDSNFNRNFHFSPDAGPGAVHFRWPGWGSEEWPQLHSGTDLLVDYDIRRLPDCRQASNGVQTWDVTVGYQFDDGTSGSASLTTSPVAWQRVARAARITAPAGAQGLSLWFENHDATGCQTWDSALGANYRFWVVE